MLVAKTYSQNLIVDFDDVFPLIPKNAIAPLTISSFLFWLEAMVVRYKKSISERSFQKREICEAARRICGEKRKGSFLFSKKISYALR